MMNSSKKRIAGALLLMAFTAGNLLAASPLLHAAPKEEAQAQQPAQVVNINTASSEELQNLKGVGPAIAERILQYRQEHGRFEKVEDLTNVRGIGESKFEKMKGQIAV